LVRTLPRLDIHHWHSGIKCPEVLEDWDITRR
jgi:hypothetical protein